MKLGLVGQGYSDRSFAVGAQTSLNLFPQLIQDPNEQQKNKGALYGCPGRHVGATLSGNVRGLWSGAGRLFVASALNLIELNAAWGTVSTHAYASADDGLPVQIFSNGVELLLISGGFAYCDKGDGAGPKLCHVDNYAGTVNVFGSGVGWASGDKFLADGTWVGKTITINGVDYVIGNTPAPPTPTQLYLTTSPGIFPGVAYSLFGEPLSAVSGAYLDGAFFVQRPPTMGKPNYGRQVNFSALFDGATWSGLDFISKEAYPDNLRGIYSDAEQLYLLGAETGEVWASNPNAGPDDNPYQRIPSAMYRYGLFSTWGGASLDGKFYFVGGDDRGQISVYALNGFTPVRISTHAEEAAWNVAGFAPGAAVVYAYLEEGSSHLVVNFGSQTWSYTPESGAWIKRARGSDGSSPYDTNLHTFLPEWGANGRHVTACSTGTAKVYESSINFYDDAGADIFWQRALPYVYSGGKRQFFGRLDLELETGATTGATPIITYDYSDDRGHTFINPRTADAGASGDFSRRAWWNRNGSSRGRILRFSGVGQSKVALVDLQCDVDVGSV